MSSPFATPTVDDLLDSVKKYLKDEQLVAEEIARICALFCTMSTDERVIRTTALIFGGSTADDSEEANG